MYTLCRRPGVHNFRLSFCSRTPGLGVIAALAAAALVFFALSFASCVDGMNGFGVETGGDSNNSIPLAGPRSVQVTGKDAALVLQWTRVAPAQGIVPSYEVYVSTQANAAAAQMWGYAQSDSSQLVKVTIPGLTNGVTYYVWVKAVYAGLGVSAFSPTSYGMPVPPPAAPASLSVTPGEGMLELTWPSVTYAFTYEAYYKAGSISDTAPPSDTAGTMVTVSPAGVVLLGLTNGTAYTVWVRAVNTAGNSPYVKASGSPTEAALPPSTPPAKPDVAAGPGKLIVSWNQVSGVPQYKLYYNTTTVFSSATEVVPTIPASAPTVRAEILGLTNGVTYYVWVQSWNSKGGTSGGVSPSASGAPKAKDPISFSNTQFVLGSAAAEFIFAQDVPASVFFPSGGPNTDRLTRVQETALGNLFTDGAAWYIRRQYPGENIDFVFLNGGYIDNALPSGNITVGNLSAIVKSDSRNDKFLLLTLTGAQLKLLFDDIAGVVHTGRGGSGTGFFGIVSKEARYTLQYYAPPSGTSPALSAAAAELYYHGWIKAGTLKINGLDIVDGQNYRICTTDYLAAGEYFTRLYTSGTNKRLINTPFWHGAAEYIYDQGSVTPKLDGRIKIEGGVPLPAPWIPGTLIKP